MCRIGRWTIFLLLFPVITSAENSDGLKIIGGREALEGEFPYAVCIVGDIRCGGSLITLDRFITAGHCFHYKGDPIDLSKIKVLAGSVDIQVKRDGYQSRRIAAYLMHHDYRFKADTTSFHDMALAQVDNSFIISDTLAPLKLVSTEPKKLKKSWDKIVSKGSTCRSMGWGLKRVEIDANNVALVNVLRTFEARPWNNKKCREQSASGEDMTEFGEICASAVISGEMLGKGDSGCPLICEGYAYGINIAKVGLNDSSNIQRFLLFWPYMDYFEFSLYP